MIKADVSAAPRAAKVLYENETFRVLEVKLKKGQKLETHVHPIASSHRGQKMARN